MPKYQYLCPNCGDSFERYATYDDAYMACDCGRLAKRAEVYREQYISCETGPRGGQKVEPPRDEKDLRKPYAEFREASAEMDYLYSRNDDPKVKAPSYYKEGLKKARKKGAKIASH